MQSVIDHLDAICPLEPGCREFLLGKLKHKLLERNEYLLDAGETDRIICFIKTGLLRAFYWEDDHQISQSFTRDGDIVIAVFSFFSETPGEENIQALKETELFYITHEELNEAYRLFPAFNVVGRLILLKYYLLEIEKCKTLRKRTVPARYSYLREHYPWMIREISSKHIASYLNTSEQQLSRIKRKL